MVLTIDEVCTLQDYYLRGEVINSQGTYPSINLRIKAHQKQLN